MIKVGIIGANGYTGLELMNILSRHKNAELIYCASRSNAGTKVSALYPSLIGIYPDLEFCAPDAEECAKACDVVFTALPHAASAEFCAQIYKYGTKVIDLSADFRYDDLSVYEKIYSVTHPAPSLNDEAVYGLTEINRDKIKNAKIIGNPGCYTTASILALLPLIKEKVICDKGIIIDAKSGTSGAGRKADAEYGFCEIAENFKAYAIATHRHTSEIEEKLSSKGTKITLSFTPHLLPVKRGILATIYADLANNINAEKINAAYTKYYNGEQFVKVLPENTTPTLKHAVGSNMCVIGYKIDTRINKLIVVSVIDNLIKGASGQAVQNMNLMFGLGEDEGLNKSGLYL